jgi:hypothetical protein
MPVSELSRPNIAEQLLKRNVPENEKSELLRLLDACEFARFAPSADADMKQVYSDALALLTRTENYLKS